jgi:hypothetical protein
MEKHGSAKGTRYDGGVRNHKRKGREGGQERDGEEGGGGGGGGGAGPAGEKLWIADTSGMRRLERCDKVRSEA